MAKKPKIERDQYNRLKAISNLTPENCQKKLGEFLGMVEPRRARTEAQNNAIHKNCEIIAKKLNDSGNDMRKVLKEEVDIEWSTISVKEYLWRPIQKALTGKDSTTELEKGSGEIEKIHENLMRHLGERCHIEYHDFPHDPKKKKEMEEMMAPPTPVTDYPEHKGDVKF